MISVSIVSHGQMSLVKELLFDIQKCCSKTTLEVILTLNIAEVLDVDLDAYVFPIKLVQNNIPQGFGSNHNQAFKYTKGQFFCVMNPDIRLNNDPFPELVNGLLSDSIGVIAPVVVNEFNLIEDSARPFPSPIAILFKLASKVFNSSAQSRVEGSKPYEWVGGMFMLFNADTYALINGFDDRYFMYYEDVDICARLTYMGRQIVLCQATSVIHQAQRASHRSFKHMCWHISSMLRFFLSKAYWRLLWR